MRVVVFGGAGGVGRHAVDQATARGHRVAAVARRVPDGAPDAEWVRADVRDTTAFAALLDGADAVLWCVGVTKTSGGDVGRTALPPLVTAMVERGVHRFVGVSGAGTDLPGDRKGRGARFVSGLTHRLARDLVEDKEGEHRVLAGSELQWTQIRPPRLTDGSGTGRYRLTDEAPGLRAAPLPKVDAARAMLDLSEGGAWLGAAPFVLAGGGR